MRASSHCRRPGGDAAPRRDSIIPPQLKRGSSPAESAANAIVPAMTARTDAAQRARALLPGVLAGLVLTDVAGGLFDVAAGRSRPNDAWSSRATLCAPWPMIAFQASSTLVATRWRGVPSRIAAGLLALGCGVSIASGFFDGQLARRDLSTTEIGFQMFLLGATGLLGGLAAAVAATK